MVVAEVLYYVSDRADAAFVSRTAGLLRPGGTLLLSYAADVSERFVDLFEAGPFVREHQLTLTGHGFHTWVLTLLTLR